MVLLFWYDCHDFRLGFAPCACYLLVVWLYYIFKYGYLRLVPKEAWLCFTLRCYF